MIKKSLLSMLFLTSISQAYDVNELAAKMQNQIGNTTIQPITNISPDALREAQKVGNSYNQRASELENWKNSMSYEDGKIAFNQTKKRVASKQRGNFVLRSDERVYVFISSSIPKETLIQYAKTIDTYKLGANLIMVMRGCIGGCVKIKPTLRYVHSIVTADGEVKDGLKIQVLMDPLLFRKYKITKVPTFVFAQNVKSQNPELSEGLDTNLQAQPTIYKSEGDWDLEYHLKILQKKSNSQSLANLIKNMQKNGFFNSK